MPVIDLASYPGLVPHAKQREVVLAFNGGVKTAVLKWARRGGKGRCAIMALLDTYFRLASQPPRPGLVPAFHAGIIVPSYRNDQAWAEAQAFVPEALILDNGLVQDERKIYLKPYGTIRDALIEVRSAENEDGLQGWGLDFCWVSEAQDVRNSAYAKLRPGLRSPGRERILLVEGIPPLEPDHWMNNLYRLGGEGSTENAEPGYFSSHMTYLQNPMLSEEDHREVEADQGSMSDAEWRRMYLAEDPAESDIPMNPDGVLTSPVRWEDQKPDEGHVYHAGLDLGQHVSATVLTIFDTSVMPWRMVYYRRMKGADWMVQKSAVVAACNGTFMVSKLFIDAQGPGSPIYDEFRFMGLPVVAVPIQGNTRENILNKLAIAFEKRSVSIPREEQIAKECRAMRREKVSQMTNRWTTRDGYTNDTVFSMALAISELPLRDGPMRPRKQPDFYGWRSVA